MAKSVVVPDNGDCNTRMTWLYHRNRALLPPVRTGRRGRVWGLGGAKQPNTREMWDRLTHAAFVSLKPRLVCARTANRSPTATETRKCLKQVAFGGQAVCQAKPTDTRPP